MSLTKALAARRSVRSFLPTPLTKAELSQILWAAQGITDSQGHRTAPSASAQYYLHVYVTSADGIFEYLPGGHQLKKLSSQDVRSKLSGQQAVQQAPTVLILTADIGRAITKYGPDKGPRVSALEAGHATQNVLLQAAALGLGALSAAGIDPQEVHKLASLPAQETVIYLIPVGHPK
jgi:SagB-type dehydrogenase family enzyme